jgi:hypothetical protein
MKNNIKMDFAVFWWEFAEWIYFAEDRKLENKVTKLGVL